MCKSSSFNIFVLIVTLKIENNPLPLTMKKLSKILTFFYIIFPLVFVPYVAAQSANWFYLLGILCYYTGVFLVAIKQKIIFMIPLIFCFWFWYTYDFSIHDFSFFLLACMGVGGFFYQLSIDTKKFTHRTIPENKEAYDYDTKIEQMYAKLDQHKQLNPHIKITPEIMDVIKNEIFFK